MRGYRTPRSMRSQETWDAAHQYIANWILTMGMIVMGIQIPLFFLLEPSQFAIGTGIVMALGGIPLLPMTEWYLHKKYDREGKLKEPDSG